MGQIKALAQESAFCTSDTVDIQSFVHRAAPTTCRHPGDPGLVAPLTTAGESWSDLLWKLSKSPVIGLHPKGIYKDSSNS